MAHPNDGQGEIVWELENLLADPALGSEELGRALMMLESFQAAGWLAPERADQLLRDTDLLAPDGGLSAPDCAAPAREIVSSAGRTEARP